MTTSYEDISRSGGMPALEQAGRFFMQDSPVHRSLVKISKKLRALGIDHAIADGMALVAHGYERTTVELKPK